jgi:hypothetical protein
MAHGGKGSSGGKQRMHVPHAGMQQRSSSMKEYQKRTGLTPLQLDPTWKGVQNLCGFRPAFDTQSVPDFLTEVYQRKKNLLTKSGLITWFSKPGTYCKMTEAGDGAGPKPDKV